MRLVKRLMMVGLLAAILGPMMACSQGVGASKADMQRQFRRSVLYDKQMLVDDIALITLTQRPMRTTRWVMD